MPPPCIDSNMANTTTEAHRLVTGVILAGGRSARMGQDKAGMAFHGETFLDRAARLLGKMRLANIVVLGRQAAGEEQDAFPGPARALVRWLETQDQPLNLLVIPVDMPALTRPPLEHLMAQPNGAYYQDLYLPFYAPKARFEPHSGEPARLRELLEHWRLGAHAIKPEWKTSLAGVNTPHELVQLEAAIKSQKTG